MLVNLVNFCDGSCWFQSLRCRCCRGLLQALILVLLISIRGLSFVLFVEVNIVVSDVIDNIEAIIFLIFVAKFAVLFESR